MGGGVSSRGRIRVAPRWEVVPADAEVDPFAFTIRLGAGSGFGDGSHPTTALCLQALSALAPRASAFRLLDFGSGSGILSIAAALHLAALVDAVEIEPRAVEHAERNFVLNGVEGRVRQLTALPLASERYDFVVANILRSVLIANAPELTRLLAPGGRLVLSGLVSTDLPEVSAVYGALLGGLRAEVYARDVWRALVFTVRR